VNDKNEILQLNASLKAAIDKLNEFADQVNAASKPIKPTLFQKIDEIRLFWKNFFLSPTSSSESLPHDDILGAVETINRGRLQILKLSKGSDQEQKFATSITAAIDAYNQSVASAQKKSKGKSKTFNLDKKGISFPKLPKIDFPKKVSVTYQYDQQNLQPKIKNTTFCAIEAMKPSAMALSKQAEELFRMKVISLLEKCKIASNPEARDQVKTAPIQTIENGEKNGKCLLSQTFSLFPGHTVQVSLSSCIDPKTQLITALFPESFTISLQSTPSGFPHPLQRAGFTLSPELLPESPQRLDLLPRLKDVFIKRDKIAEQLQPQGKLIDKAKKALRIKQECFDANQFELLLLHKKLIKTILSEVKEVSLLDNSDRIINDWYEWIADQKGCYRILSNTYYQIGNNFISNPYKKVVDAIFSNRDSNDRRSAVYQALSKEIKSINYFQADPNKKIKSSYINLMGKIFGQASLAIIMQYLSEDLLFTPPTLSLFEKKTQSLSIRHEIDFLNEMEKSDEEILSSENCLSNMKTALLSDISVFQGQADFQEVDELATYYLNRSAST